MLLSCGETNFQGIVVFDERLLIMSKAFFLNFLRWFQMAVIPSIKRSTLMEDDICLLKLFWGSKRGRGPEGSFKERISF